MTPNEAVSLLRNTLKEHTDTSSYSSGYLWALFSAGLARVKEEKLRRYGYNNPNYYHTFCIEMVEGLTHDCDCIELGCKALVSKNKIPEYLTSNTQNTLSVFKLSGKRINQIENYEYYESFKYDEAYNKSGMFYMNNSKIILPNQTEPRVLQVRGVWKDILEWSPIQFCTSENSDDCDINKLHIGIDPGMEIDVLRHCFFVLNIPLQTKEDNLADNNSDIK